MRSEDSSQEIRIYEKPLIGKRSILILDGCLLVAGILAPFICKMLLAFPFDCWVQKMGYLCPACGGTRAVALVFQGKFIEAFSMNLYFMISGCVMLIGLVMLHISCFCNNVFAGKFSRRFFRPWIAILWATGFLLFGILRNLL